jgi:hypothetical protein
MSEENKTKIIYSKIVDKVNNAGNVTGKMTIEKKTYMDHVFIQLTQDKFAFGKNPAKKNWVTFSPDDKAILEALKDSLKA